MNESHLQEESSAAAAAGVERAMSQNRPISEAKSALLRGSLPALQRAGERARELAAQQGTTVWVKRDGCFVEERPEPAPVRKDR